MLGHRQSPPFISFAGSSVQNLFFSPAVHEVLHTVPPMGKKKKREGGKGKNIQRFPPALLTVLFQKKLSTLGRLFYPALC